MAGPAQGSYDSDDYEEFSEEEEEVVETEADSVSTSVPQAGNDHGPCLPARPQGRRGSHSSHSAGSLPPQSETVNGVSEENRAVQLKLQNSRVSLLRLARRLGQTPRNTIVNQVMYRLQLAEQIKTNSQGRPQGQGQLEASIAMAQQLEAESGPDSDLGIACTLVLLGKSGVGKSATINSILDKDGASVSGLEPETKAVREVVCTFKGVKLRIIDTPGLKVALTDQKHNEDILKQVKKFLKGPPDLFLYFERLDVMSRDMDVPIHQTIAHVFGRSIWLNTIVVLTHASSPPPEKSDGQPMPYEEFIAVRTSIVHEMIRRAANDNRLMNPVIAVENHRNCRRDSSDERMLPNGQLWRPNFLLMCFGAVVIAQANTTLQLNAGQRPYQLGSDGKSAPLPYLLSTLITPRQPRRLPPPMPVPPTPEDEEDEELLEEEEAQLRAAKGEGGKPVLRKQVGTPPPASREALAGQNMPVADPPLPPTFDSENPAYRLRTVRSQRARNDWMVQPVPESNTWDHDFGLNGVSFEKNFVVREEIPVGFSGQVQLDKEQRNVNVELEGSYMHDEARVTTAGADVQTVGQEQLCCSLRSETRFRVGSANKLAAGGSLYVVDRIPCLGLKLDDRIKVSDSCRLVVSGGGVVGAGEKAWGANAELVHVNDDITRGRRSRMALGLSLMDWRGDLAIGGNFEGRVPLKECMFIGRAQLNSRGAGTLAVKISTAKHFTLSAFFLIPFLRSLVRKGQDMLEQ